MDDFERRRELRRQKREEMRLEVERLANSRNDDDDEEAARERRRRARQERLRNKEDDESTGLGTEKVELNNTNSVVDEEPKSVSEIPPAASEDEQALLEKLAKREERRQRRLQEALDRQKEFDPTVSMDNHEDEKTEGRYCPPAQEEEQVVVNEKKEEDRPSEYNAYKDKEEQKVDEEKPEEEEATQEEAVPEEPQQEVVVEKEEEAVVEKPRRSHFMEQEYMEEKIKEPNITVEIQEIQEIPKSSIMKEEVIEVKPKTSYREEVIEEKPKRRVKEEVIEEKPKTLFREEEVIEEKPKRRVKEVVEEKTVPKEEPVIQEKPKPCFKRKEVIEEKPNPTLVKEEEAKQEKPKRTFTRDEVTDKKVTEKKITKEPEVGHRHKPAPAEPKQQNGEEFHVEKHKKPERTPSRGNVKASPEAEEQDAASRQEAERKLEELKRRRDETESGEFEKLRQKQQEAEMELEELKRKREGRRKVLEEEGQRKKQEEAEKKAREEEEKRRMKEEIEKRRAEAAEKRQKITEEAPEGEGKKPFKCVSPRGSSLKIGERAEFLNKSAQKSGVKASHTPIVSKIDNKLEQYTTAIQSNKDPKPPKPGTADLPVGDVRNIKSMWEKGNVFGSPGTAGGPNKEATGLKFGVASRINDWLNKTPESGKAAGGKPADLKPGDVTNKRSLWENKATSPDKSSPAAKMTTGGKSKSVTNGMGH
ncbi:non-muscle caldesmon isoform X2 [Amia ocellicauda]|uniref:non-muscle caldesmon isoform X2 n=1 Tax=Amia ocellicauda TaxID=2972642 RepID=UPI0034640B3B